MFVKYIIAESFNVGYDNISHNGEDFATIQGRTRNGDLVQVSLSRFEVAKLAAAISIEPYEIGVAGDMEKEKVSNG